METILPECNVKPFIDRHLDDVLVIENDIFQWDSWTKKDFGCMKNRHVAGVVVEFRESVVAYAVYSWKGGVIDVRNFAVARELWGQGIGSKVIQRMKDRLAENPEFRRIVFDVPDDNLRAHQFLQSHRFRCHQVKRNYFVDGVDAYQFVFRSTMLEDEIPPSRKRS